MPWSSLLSEDRWARAAWSRVSEPGDPSVLRWIASLGAAPALAAVREAALAGAERLQPRLAELDLERDLEVASRVGAKVLVPGDADWPQGVSEHQSAPVCLWARGERSLGQACERAASIVGARAATRYGEEVAREMAAGLAERGFAVMSGAAFGIDAAAHRGALAVGGLTIAVLASGVDRPYPAAHANLLTTIVAEGLVVSEVAPGSAPTRSRFLRRNRIIATATNGTIIVEAGLRSGSLSTAGEAEAHGRPVAAVPGPVTSMVSAGCHQWIREGRAQLVTDAAEAAELLGRLGDDLAPERRGAVSPDDGLGQQEKSVLDALPFRKAAPVRDLVRLTTLGLPAVMAALGQLEALGMAQREGDLWRKKPRKQWSTY
ncbi:MAG TPA: DNA-processing protein DprA [Dermatophilaceae bacterium]|nr:DNA-processing protein DprA [Dermatophilaceae bacterium]